MRQRGLNLALLPALEHGLTQSDYIHICVLITICLAWSIPVEPPIPNETTPSDPDAMAIKLSPRNEDVRKVFFYLMSLLLNQDQWI